jgi:hypothetical protein
MDGLAVPIWRSSDFTDQPEQRLPAGLFCAYVTRGLLYDDNLRSLSAEAWRITTLTNRSNARGARLSTIQANLLDLDGRPSLNPTGNSMLLGQVGFHYYCYYWQINDDRAFLDHCSWTLDGFAFGLHDVVNSQVGKRPPHQTMVGPFTARQMVNDFKQFPIPSTKTIQVCIVFRSL